MRRFIVLVVSILLLAGSAAYAQGKSPKKRVSKAKADSTLCITGIPSDKDINAMVQQMQQQSGQMYAQAMHIMRDMNPEGMPSPDIINSMMDIQLNASPDSTRKIVRRHIGRGPRNKGQAIFSTTDSTGTCQSIVVISKDGKTTIIRNGKDTTVVNGPFVPERDMPDLNFNFDFPSMPSLGRFPSWNFSPFNFNNNDISVRHFNDSIESETPSVEESEMLIKKGVVSSNDFKSPLDIIDLVVNPKMKNSTLSVSFKLKDADQCNLSIVDAQGNIVEKVTLKGTDKEFRRTVKVNKGSDYLFIVVGVKGKASACKVWL